MQNVKFNNVITNIQHVLVVVCLVGVISFGYSFRSYQEVVNGRLDSGFSQVTTSSAQQIKAGFYGLEKQVTPVTTQATATLKAGQTLLDTANRQLGSVDLDARSKEATKSLTDTAASVSSLAASLSASATKVNTALDSVNDALPYILDCDPSHAGPDCLPNKYLELAGESEKTLKAVARAAPDVAASIQLMASAGPKIEASVDGIADDFHGITSEGLVAVKKFNKPLTKMQKLGAFVKLGMVIVIKAL